MYSSLWRQCIARQAEPHVDPRIGGLFHVALGNLELEAVTLDRGSVGRCTSNVQVEDRSMSMCNKSLWPGIASE